jgi:hypothetical protein
MADMGAARTLLAATVAHTSQVGVVAAVSRAAGIIADFTAAVTTAVAATTVAAITAADTTQIAATITVAMAPAAVPAPDWWEASSVACWEVTD